MEVPTYISDMALPQGQQGSSDLPPSPGSSRVNVEVRYLICGDTLQVYRLVCVFRCLLTKEHYDMCASYAPQVIASRKAARDILERPTIPVCASFAISNGVAATSTGSISRIGIQVSTATGY